MATDPFRHFCDQHGFAAPDVPCLLPLAETAELVGGELAGRLAAVAGGMCLRPDFTIPVAKMHAAGGAKAGEYCAAGPVFRLRQGAAAEIRQAGVEVIDDGRHPDKADGRIVALALELSKELGVAEPLAVFGDQALFADLLIALDAPPAWRERLLGGFGNPAAMERVLRRIGELAEEPAPAYPDRAMESVQEAVIEHGGMTAGRSTDEIAHGLARRANLARAAAAMRKTVPVIEAYLQIKCPLAEARRVLDGFCQTHKVAGMLDPVNRFNRTAVNAKPELFAKAEFAAGFGRGPNYYSGLVFDFRLNKDDPPYLGGGRYDGLLRRMGGQGGAVGFALRPDRLPAKAAK